MLERKIAQRFAVARRQWAVNRDGVPAADPPQPAFERAFADAEQLARGQAVVARLVEGLRHCQVVEFAKIERGEGHGRVGGRSEFHG